MAIMTHMTMGVPLFLTYRDGGDVVSCSWGDNLQQRADLNVRRGQLRSGMGSQP